MRYMIDIDTKNPFVDKNGETLYKAEGFNSLVFDQIGLNKLTQGKVPEAEYIKGCLAAWKLAQNLYRNNMLIHLEYGYKEAQEVYDRLVERGAVHE